MLNDFDLVERDMTPEARGILTYPGGKWRLAARISQHLPLQITDWIEPFCGGCGMFLSIAKRVTGDAHLNDACEKVYYAASGVKSHLDNVLDILRRHKALHSREHFIEVLDKHWDPDNYADQFERGADFAYLTKACFNGSIVSSATGNSVGKLDGTGLFDEKNLRNASKAFQKATIHNKDFSDMLRFVTPGATVYLDPPYDESKFEYGRPFTRADQERVYEFFRECVDRGASVIQSNAMTEWIQERYRDFTIHSLDVNRSMRIGDSGRNSLRYEKESLIVHHPSSPEAPEPRR